MKPHPITILQTPKLFDIYCSPCGGTPLSCSLGLAGTVLSLSLTLLSCSLGLTVPFDLGVFLAPLCPNTVIFSSFNRLWALHSSNFVALISHRPLVLSSPNFAHISYTFRFQHIHQSNHSF